MKAESAAICPLGSLRGACTSLIIPRVPVTNARNAVSFPAVQFHLSVEGNVPRFANERTKKKKKIIFHGAAALLRNHPLLLFFLFASQLLTQPSIKEKKKKKRIARILRWRRSAAISTRCRFAMNRVARNRRLDIAYKFASRIYGWHRRWYE